MSNSSVYVDEPTSYTPRQTPMELPEFWPQKDEGQKKGAIETRPKMEVEYSNEENFSLIIKTHHGAWCVGDTYQGVFKLKDLGRFLKQKLVEYYKYEVAHLCVNPTDPDDTMPIASIYIRPILQIDNSDTPNEPLKSYTTLFKKPQGGGEVKRVLVQARAGFGKTSFTFKLAFDWVLGVDEALNEYENVFLLSLRKVTAGQGVAGAIKAQLFEDVKVSEEELDEYIKSNDKILLVLDGLDEMDDGVSPEFLKVVQRKNLRHVCVLITSVPCQAGNLTLTGKYIDVHAKIEGFKITDRKKFISKFVLNLKGMSNQSEAEEMTSKLLEEIARNNLEGISQIPLLLNMLCILYIETESLPNSISETYNVFLEWLHQRYLTKGNISETHEVKEAYDLTILKLGELGLDGLLQLIPRLYFKRNEIREHVGDMAFSVGLISTEKKKAKIGANTQYHFLHQSFQENTAACFLAKSVNNKDYQHWKKLKEYLASPEKVLEKGMLFQFCTGESEELAKMVLRFIDQKTIQSDPKLEWLIKEMTSIDQNGRSSLVIEKNARKLLKLEAKCLMNMKKPADCLIQYLFGFLSKTKTIQKAKEIGVLKSNNEMSGSNYWTVLFESKYPVSESRTGATASVITDSGSPTLASMNTQISMQDNQEKGFEGENKGPEKLNFSEGIRVESLEGSLPQGDFYQENSRTHFVQESQSDLKSHKATPEKEWNLKTLFDINRKWRKRLLEMEEVDAVGMTPPPIKIVIFVKSKGKVELEELLRKELGETDMLEYISIKDIGNGMKLTKQFLPQMSVDLDGNTGPLSQTLTCLVREKKSGDILALTCNHGDNHSKAKFLTDSIDGQREIEIGKLFHQITLDDVPENCASASACAPTTDQSSRQGGNVEVTAITVSSEVLEEYKRSAAVSGQTFTISDIYRPEPYPEPVLEPALEGPDAAELQFIDFLSSVQWLVQKVGNKTELTTGKILYHNISVDQFEDGKPVKFDHAIIVYSSKEPTADATTEDSLQRQVDTDVTSCPIQETQEGYQQEPVKNPGHLETHGRNNDDMSLNITSDLFTEPGDSGSAITTRPSDDSPNVILLAMHLFGSKFAGKACSVAIPMSAVLDRLEAEKGVTLENSPFRMNTSLVRGGMRISEEKQIQAGHSNLDLPVLSVVKNVSLQVKE